VIPNHLRKKNIHPFSVLYSFWKTKSSHPFSLLFSNASGDANSFLLMDKTTESVAAPTPAQSPVPDPEESTSTITPGHIVIISVTVSLILMAWIFGCVMHRRRKRSEREGGGRRDPEVKFRLATSSRRRNHHASEMTYSQWLETARGGGLPAPMPRGSDKSDEVTLTGNDFPPPDYESSIEQAHIAPEKI
jgi:hypothetical protein